jgi:hypothetical protein
MSRRPRVTPRAQRDDGVVLLYVLILMVLGALIVVPTLEYATSVTKQNSVLSTKVKRQEAVKAGLRTALADPIELYHHCAERSTVLPGPGIDGVPVASRCEFLAFSLATTDEELHLGLAATRVGEVIPDGLVAVVKEDAAGNPVLDSNGKPVRYVYAPTGSDTTEWYNPSAEWAPLPESTAKHIWAPNLPVHGLNLRPATGYNVPIPDDPSTPGVDTCTAYFPGTYTDPVTFTGPTYLASGIYYFENTVTVGPGADVVVGAGQNAGCTFDQEAIFNGQGAPTTHNISGRGGTFVFGQNGQLVVSNVSGSPKIRFNQRYVNDDDTANLPSFGVSIMSVNGKTLSGPSTDGTYTLGDLLVPGVDQVPASVVGLPSETSTPTPAGAQRYRASLLTHEPRPPGPPQTVAASPLKTGTGTNQGAAKVTWTPPTQLGGQAITGYTVRASGSVGQQCSTTGALECVVTGLAFNTNYTFTVTATNSLGTSVASAASASIMPRTTTPVSPTVAAPAQITNPTAVRYGDKTVLVSWTAPANNNATITAYTVAPTPAFDTVAKPCIFVSATSCMFRSLPAIDAVTDYTFTVTATNQMGTSTPSNPTTLTASQIPAAAGSSPATPPPTPPVVIPPYEPDPIVKIDLTGTNPAVIDIPGYVSVPMGLVSIQNPNGLGDDDGSTVAISGGILAAGFRVNDARSSTGSGELTVPIGLINPVVQRTYKIISQTTSGLPKVVSTAVVQINQNGAYAINSWEVQ